MTPALVIIPQTCGTINRDRYLADCIRYTMTAGYFPLSKDIYANYTNMDPDKFIKVILEFCSVVYLFIDFRIDDLMSRTAEKAVKKGILVTYVKISPNEPTIYTLSPHDILQEVSKKTGIPIERLKEKTRKREIVDARFIYFRRCRDVLGISYERIGLEVGGKDHATVMHGIKETENTKQVVEQYNQYYGTGK